MTKQKDPREEYREARRLARDAHEAQRKRARDAYAALATPEGLDAAFPHDRSHGWKYPAGRKARRVIANQGKRIRSSDEKALRKHRKRSMMGMVRAAQRSATTPAPKG